MPELLNIQPGELKFPFELKKQISCSLKLQNTTEDYVAFKVKTTSPKKYCVRPNTGVVAPQSTAEIIVTMQAQREAPPDMQCKDKFLVQSVVAPVGMAAKDVTQEMFSKESGSDVHEAKLRVIYTSPPEHPSPVEESAEEYSQPHTAASNGDWGYGFSDAPKDVNELKLKLTEVRKQLTTLTEERNNALQLNQQLQQELAKLGSATDSKGYAGKGPVQRDAGFSFLFVFLVGLLGILVGYLIGS